MSSSTKLDADTFEQWKGQRSHTTALCDLLVLLKDYGIEIKTMMKSVYDVSTCISHAYQDYYSKHYVG